MLRPQLIVFAVCAVLAAFVLSWGLGCLTIPQRARRGVVVQGLFRSNYLIIGLPFASGLLEGAELGVVTVLGAVVVPLYNVLAVIVLEANNGGKPSPGKLLRGIAKNPLILGSLAGILFLVLGIRLPDFLETPVRDLSRAASPLLLFLLGASFSLRSFRSYRKELWITCLGRLIVIPGLGLLAGGLLGFRGVEYVTLMGMLGSGTAANSFTMAQQMGGDADLAGDIVVLTGALCTVTLFGWSLLSKALGMF